MVQRCSQKTTQIRKINTLSSFFSSVFTTEDCEHSPLIEDKQLTTDMNNIEINEEKVKRKLSA